MCHREKDLVHDLVNTLLVVLVANGQLIDELARDAHAPAGQELEGVERGANVVARLLAQGDQAADFGAYVGDGADCAEALG